MGVHLSSAPVPTRTGPASEVFSKTVTLSEWAKKKTLPAKAKRVGRPSVKLPSRILQPEVFGKGLFPGYRQAASPVSPLTLSIALVHFPDPRPHPRYSLDINPPPCTR